MLWPETGRLVASCGWSLSTVRALRKNVFLVGCSDFMPYLSMLVLISFFFFMLCRQPAALLAVKDLGENPQKAR
jgi:hypothetical protein